MDSRLICLIAILIILLSASCGTYPQSEDICNPDSEIFHMLEDKYQEWAILAQNIPSASNGVATVKVDKHTYSVRVLKFTRDHLAILSISTDEGYPRTWIGNSGYFYAPTGELLMLASPYKIQQMTEHIYCYWRE